MTAVYALTRDTELAVQDEATYGTSPGAVVGGDMFKHKSSVHFARHVERYNRDQDRDGGQASVLSTQKGRERAGVSIECDLIPSGVSATPTEPDIDLIVQALLGTKHKCTAHTTAAAGSAGTSLVLAGGGGAASGIVANDLIAIDYAGTGDYEVRRTVSIATDTVTLDRALTSDPAAGRAVKVGTTYKLLASALKSLHVWQWNNFLKYKVPGCIIKEGEFSINMADKAPVAQVKFTGEGQPKIAHATARPTPVTAGQPLVPSIGKLWLGATRINGLVQAMLKVNNGYELRDSEADALFPLGVKRTGNKSRYDVTLTLETFLRDELQTYFDGASSLTAYNVLLQLGISVGSMFAICVPKWQPDADEQEQDGEVGMKVNGKCYGGGSVAAVDDEVFLGFI